MSFIVVVPARYASTRFPGKPLIDLNGRPMVVRVAERAQQSAATRVMVATDDPRIAAACDEFGVATVMTRSDQPTGTDRLSEVVQSLNLSDDAVVVNVQGDEPLIPATVINQVAALLNANPNAAMATLCHPIHDVADVLNPNVVKCVINELGEAMYFSRAPIPFARDAWRTAVDSMPDGLPMYRHIGLYAYRAGFLRRFPELSIPAVERYEALEQLRALAHGFRVAVAVVEAALPPGIDTPEDYERLKAAYSKSGDTFWT